MLKIITRELYSRARMRRIKQNGSWYESIGILVAGWSLVLLIGSLIAEQTLSIDLYDPLQSLVMLIALVSGLWLMGAGVLQLTIKRLR